MATFVLIHGAWHGGWKWRIVAPALRRAGHEVYAPSLTGLGCRKHLARPGPTLDTHIQDVVSILEMEDLREVVLVGHSYGGMVVTGAADRLPERIAELVYLDAFVPENGRCLLDYVVPERAGGMREAGARTGAVPPPPLSLWGHVDDRFTAFIGPREVHHPFGTMTQPIRLQNEAALARIPKTFIYCSSPATGSFGRFAEKARNDPTWRFHELATGHDAMLLVPEALTGILLRTACARAGA